MSRVHFNEEIGIVTANPIKTYTGFRCLFRGGMGIGILVCMLASSLQSCKEQEPQLATYQPVTVKDLREKSVDAVDLEEPEEPTDAPYPMLRDSLSYDEVKIGIVALREVLRQNYKNGNIGLDSVGAVFADHLANRIIPYWYDTEWSFEGHTAVPRRGKIACGYFISTTLRDMGLRLNRYKMAQKGPLEEAKYISSGTLVKSFRSTSSEDAIEILDAMTSNGIYFIGFDKGHVGYLLKQRETLYLVHSNYLFPATVAIEPLESSKVFQSFQKFHVVPISNNHKLLERWLNYAQIQ